MSSILKQIHSLINAMEDFHDIDTSPHETRTGQLMQLLGRELGYDKRGCEILLALGEVHDIGKIGIPTEILEKPSTLNSYERKAMELHTKMGYELLQKLQTIEGNIAANVALNHHEAFDGTGYPNKLKGEEIPIEARICTICDVYDALRHDRSYHVGLKHDETVRLLFNTNHPECMLEKFDPVIVKVFLKLDHEIEELYET